MKTDYTRDELIQIARAAMVPQDRWRDRDSCVAQIQRGQCLALLESGCHFHVRDGVGYDTALITNERTIWLRFWVHDFNWFEWGGDEKGNEYDEKTFYLPTPARLEEAAGRDWY